MEGVFCTGGYGRHRRQWVKFEKNQEFSPKIRNLLKLNLHSPVKENQNVSILFVERQSIQLSETGYNKT